jgi:hypothetical protein
VTCRKQYFKVYTQEEKEFTIFPQCAETLDRNIFPLTESIKHIHVNFTTGMLNDKYGAFSVKF